MPSWTDVRSWIPERNPGLTEINPETDIIEKRISDCPQFVGLVLSAEP